VLFCPWRRRVAKEIACALKLQNEVMQIISRKFILPIWAKMLIFAFRTTNTLSNERRLF
jgi:hypothetical protein